MNKQEWEAKCKRCGRCCYRLVVDDSGTLYRHTELHCSGYDPDTKSCKDYADRFRLHPNCRELFPLMLASCTNGFLPPDCGYMEEL